MDHEGLFPGSDFSPSEEKKKEPGKPRLRKIDRRQMVLHPVEIERLIPLDHEVRALWEFLGSLDLTPYHDHIESREGKAGAPAFEPRLLACIWLYSYSKGVNSAREVAKLTEYHPAYQWLTGMRPVNYHTLADFRSSHGKALSDLYAQTLAVLSCEGLITMERVAHDGTKIRSFAGKKGFRSRKTVKKFLAQAKAQIKAMEEAPEEEMGLRRKKARERAARERKERLSHALQELKKIVPRTKEKEERVSITDPECRIMKQPGGGFDLSYNLQISTDAHEKAIVALSLSPSANDQTLLEEAIDVMEETTGLPDQLLVDQGFTARANILAADEKGIDLIGPMSPPTAGKATTLRMRGITEEFAPDKFFFEPERNGVICPKGKLLRFRFKRVQRGKTLYHYQGKECMACPSKPSCSPTSKKGRVVYRLENDPKIIAFLEKMNTPEAKAIYKKRAEVAEFPNLWIKEKFGLRRFRLRGRIKAEMEARWACLTYNIKLWIRLCWKPRLEAKMG
jgi:transposase